MTQSSHMQALRQERHPTCQEVSIGKVGTCTLAEETLTESKYMLLEREVCTREIHLNMMAQVSVGVYKFNHRSQFAP